MLASKPKTASAGLDTWLLLFFLALILIFALLPINLQNIPGDWQITASAPALRESLPRSLLSVAEKALQPEHASLWIVPLARRKRMDKEA